MSGDHEYFELKDEHLNPDAVQIGETWNYLTINEDHSKAQGVLFLKIGEMTVFKLLKCVVCKTDLGIKIYSTKPGHDLDFEILGFKSKLRLL